MSFIIPLNNAKIMTFTDQHPQRRVMPDLARSTVVKPNSYRFDLDLDKPMLVNGEETIITADCRGGTMIVYYQAWGQNTLYQSPELPLYRIHKRGVETSIRPHVSTNSKLGGLPANHCWPLWDDEMRPDFKVMQWAWSRYHEVWPNAFLLESWTAKRSTFRLLTKRGLTDLKADEIFAAFKEATATKAKVAQSSMFD